MDCPYYEQLQYVGDTRIQALVSLYVSGDSRLMRKAIEMFDSSRSSIGITSSRHPSSREQLIPTFSLYWISIIHDYVKHCGADARFAKRYAQGIRSVVEWFASNLDSEKNILKPAMPFWNFADWCTSPGKQKGWHESGWRFGVPPEGKNAGSALNTLHFAYALRHASKLLELSGDSDTAKKYDALRRKILDSVCARCFDKSRGVFVDYEGAVSSSQHVNIMAILAGAVPESGRAALMDKILNDASLTQCTFYYRFYLTEAMRKSGMGDMYISQLKPWRDMIKIGLTTFAENPEPARSDCHAWSSSPNYHLLSLVAGITPGDYGFKKVTISPNLGTLNEISGSMPHPNGEIKVNFRKNLEGGMDGTIILPEGLGGKFVWRGSKSDLTPGENSIHVR